MPEREHGGHGGCCRQSKPVAEMKRIVFGEGLMCPTLDGSKHFTIRLYRAGAHDFKRDDIAIGEFKDGLDILVRITDDTIAKTFKELKRSQKTAKRDGGYHFDQAYYDDLKNGYYGDKMGWDVTGAVIQYEVLKVNGVPVVQFNQHGRLPASSG